MDVIALYGQVMDTVNVTFDKPFTPLIGESVGSDDGFVHGLVADDLYCCK